MLKPLLFLRHKVLNRAMAGSLLFALMARGFSSTMHWLTKTMVG